MRSLTLIVQRVGRVDKALATCRTWKPQNESQSRFVSGLFKKCGSNSVGKVFGILFLERPTRERDQAPAREGQAAKTNTCSSKCTSYSLHITIHFCPTSSNASIKASS